MNGPNGIPARLRVTFTVVEGGSGCLRFLLFPSVDRVFAILYAALAFRSAA